MKILDRYIVRQLFIPIFYCTGILIFLILIADLFDNMDVFLKNKAPVRIILAYYAALVPYAYTQIIPWACWLGTLFLLVSLGFHNETIAMKAAGLKITAITKPVFFLGFLVAIFSFIVSDRIVPKSFHFAEELRTIYIEERKDQSYESVMQNVTFYVNSSQIYFFGTFSQATGEVTTAICLWLDEKEINKRRRMIAKRGRYSPEGWIFEDVTEYQIDSRGRILGEPKMYQNRRYEEMRFTPRDITNASSQSMFLSYRELKDAIHKLKENGAPVRQEKVELHQRLANPWTAMVMMMMCVPFLARTTNRKAIALNVLLCVISAFVFHVFGAVSVAMGRAGTLFPFLSAWLGNIVFASASLSRMDKANY